MVLLSSQPYEYDLLPEDQAYIRLIVLQPDPEPDAPVRCLLITRTLATFEEDIIESYVALSYVWGDANDTRAVDVEGCRVNVTASLDCALRYLRHSHIQRYIWADALCINQADVVERNRQVAIMTNIYSAARHTVIFLGEGTESSDHMMKNWMSNDINIINEDIIDKEIFSRQWFQRIWVLQELVLSADPWFQIGHHKMKWPLLCEGAFRFKKMIPAIDIHRKEPFLRMWEARNQYRQHLEFRIRRGTVKVEDFSKVEKKMRVEWEKRFITSLVNILRSRRGMGASNPRDFIYANQGLAEYAHPCAFAINYEVAVSEVFQAVARLFILHNGAVVALQDVRRHKQDRNEHNLPSWVPNWTESKISQVSPIETQGSRKKSPPLLKLASTRIPGALALVGWSRSPIEIFLADNHFRELETFRNELGKPDANIVVPEFLRSCLRKRASRFLGASRETGHILDRQQKSTLFSLSNVTSRDVDIAQFSPEFKLILEVLWSYFCPYIPGTKFSKQFGQDPPGERSLPDSQQRTWWGHVNFSLATIGKDLLITLRNIIPPAPASELRYAMLQTGELLLVPAVACVNDTIMVSPNPEHLLLLRACTSPRIKVDEGQLWEDLMNQTSETLWLDYKDRLNHGDLLGNSSGISRSMLRGQSHPYLQNMASLKLDIPADDTIREFQFVTTYVHPRMADSRSWFDLFLWDDYPFMTLRPEIFLLR